jgi:PAS domain S-box-containing protein
MGSEFDHAGGAAQNVTATVPGAATALSPMEVSPDPLITVGLDGMVTDLNEAMSRLIGLSRDSVKLTGFSGWFTEPEQAAALCAQALANGFVADFPLTIRLDGGGFANLLFNASVYCAGAGRKVGLFLAARDVTEGPVAELQFRTFFEAAPDAMVLINSDGTILLMNNQTERLFGYRREELIGKAVEILVPARFRDGHPGHRSKFFAEPRVRVMGLGLDLWGLRADGTEFPIEISLSPIESPSGLTVGAIIRDVTFQRAASGYARSLLEASLDPLVTISVEGKITDVNEATIKVTGVPREGLIGTDFSNYFTEPEQAREGYLRVFANGFVTNYPLTIRHKLGQLTEVLYNASLYKDTGGNVIGVFASARDMTETKRLMREFEATKNLLDNILDSSTRYSIIGKDLNHRVVSWNEGARRNYLYTAAEILGHDVGILHTPEDRESGAVRDLLTTAFDKGMAEGEFERVRRDGSRFWANVVMTRRDDKGGKPIGYLLMSNDISARKQAEEQVHVNSLYARSLIEASLDPLVTISPAGKITDLNEATAKVTGLPREQLVGTDFSDYFTEPEKAREGYQRVFAEGSVIDYPLTIRHRNKGLIEVTYNATVYKDPRGKVLGVFAGARDVTAQRRAEAQIAEQRSKELDRLGDLERFQKLTIGRELKMIELKKEIKELKEQSNMTGVESVPTTARR